MHSQVDQDGRVVAKLVAGHFQDSIGERSDRFSGV
jgi:hypothetical protein